MKQCKWKSGYRLLAALTIGVAMFCSGTVEVVAANPASHFSVRAVLPENQVDPDLTYFDLRMAPGQTQTVEIAVTNSEDVEIEAYVEVNAADTGENGLIIYEPSDEHDASMAYPISQLAEVAQPSIRIPAGESKTVGIRIKMPEEPVDGVVLGGISVTANRIAYDETETVPGLSLQNQYRYVLGLKLTANDGEVAPDFHLQSIEPGLVNHRTAVSVNLQQSEPTIVKGMHLTAQVYKKDGGEPYRELELSDAEMAPNSNGNFIIDWLSHPLDSGDYRLKMRVEHLGRVWEWDEWFTIGAAEAGGANAGAVNLPPSSSYGKYLVWVLLLVFAVAVIAYLLGKRRKDKERFERG